MELVRLVALAVGHAAIEVVVGDVSYCMSEDKPRKWRGGWRAFAVNSLVV